MKRRQFVHAATATSAIAGLGLLGGCATPGPGAPKVVVVGAGYGGATAAKYLRLFSNQGIDVTLVEPNASFISCPISNLVLGGHKNMAFITHSYENLQRRHGVKLVRDSVTRIDAEQRRVRLAGGGELPYDRLILSPGIDFMWETLPGMASQAAKDKVLHAWKAGPQTAALRQQLQAMPDGGVYALSIPMAPYRCPPGPYERACMVASYFKQAKPRSKVIIFDANDDVTSKRGLFLRAWADHYKDIIEYRPKHRVTDVDTATNTLQFEFNDPFTASVANVVPSMRAGAIAVQSGLATANQRWCEVDFLTFESRAAKHIHILGDSILAAPLMPKSGHMANQHAKVCAAALMSLLQGKEPPSLPLYANTCYSFVTAEQAIHVASVHRFDAAQRTMLTVPGSGGVSSAANELEAFYAIGWARNIWADSLG